MGKSTVNASSNRLLLKPSASKQNLCQAFISAKLIEGVSSYLVCQYLSNNSYRSVVWVVRFWTSGVIYADTNAKYITGLWDKQELAEYALGQVLEDTSYEFGVETFVSQVPNIIDGSKVYTNLVDWKIDCWTMYIKDAGLALEVLDELQQLGLKDAVLQKLNAYC